MMDDTAEANVTAVQLMITLEHQPAHMSSYRPIGCPSPIRPKYMAGPISVRSNARFIPHIGNSVPCEHRRDNLTLACGCIPGRVVRQDQNPVLAPVTEKTRQPHTAVLGA